MLTSGSFGFAPLFLYRTKRKNQEASVLKAMTSAHTEFLRLAGFSSHFLRGPSWQEALMELSAAHTANQPVFLNHQTDNSPSEPTHWVENLRHMGFDEEVRLAWKAKQKEIEPFLHDPFLVGNQADPGLTQKWLQAIKRRSDGLSEAFVSYALRPGPSSVEWQYSQRLLATELLSETAWKEFEISLRIPKGVPLLLSSRHLEIYFFAKKHLKHMKDKSFSTPLHLGFHGVADLLLGLLYAEDHGKAICLSLDNFPQVEMVYFGKT